MKIRNKPMNTPDTEWEKEFDEIWEARPAPEQRTHLKEAIKEFISSHTTYWKERELEAYKSGMRAGRNDIFKMNGVQELTNKSNLK